MKSIKISSASKNNMLDKETTKPWYKQWRISNMCVCVLKGLQLKGLQFAFIVACETNVSQVVCYLLAMWNMPYRWIRDKGSSASNKVSTQRRKCILKLPVTDACPPRFSYRASTKSL
jgi:hypothetical protein